jgi:hypothetical protein
MCEIFFKKIDHIDCKTKVFELKKRAFIASCKTWLGNFEFSWLITFALFIIKIFDFMLTPKGPKAIFRPFLKFGQAILKTIIIKNS